MITAGMSRTGGKFRLRKVLLEHTPRHEYFLSLFCGACWYELNKPRARYECFNDLDSELINYLKVIERYPEEFEKYKQGVFGLASQRLFLDILEGKIAPRDDIERAYFFYYMNKLCFGGKMSTYIGLMIIPRKEEIPPVKSHYRGITPKEGYRGINPNTTRPHTTNDCGLLTPLDPKCIERLRYVNLTCYDFRKIYKMFHKAYYERKGIEREALVYADPPYPGTEKYYGTGFEKKDHEDLIRIMLDTPFNFMLSIGGECDFYLEALTGAGWSVKEVYTKYSTDANSQDLVKEYIIMNYDIDKLPKMKAPSSQKVLLNFMGG